MVASETYRAGSPLPPQGCAIRSGSQRQGLLTVVTSSGGHVILDEIRSAKRLHYFMAPIEPRGVAAAIAVASISNGSSPVSR